MRGVRVDRSKRYTPVPQALSDEDEGVYDDSPESSPQTELLSTEGISSDANYGLDNDDIFPNEIKTLSFCSSSYSYHKPGHSPPLALIDVTASSSAKSPDMSYPRLACFLISMAVCVMYAVALLWLVPCHFAPCSTKTGPYETPKMRLEEWNRTFLNIRFTSRPQLVRVRPDGQTVVLLSYQHITKTSEGDPAEESGSGVLALQGDSGEEVWKCVFHTDVVDLVCGLSDINKDGVNDCIIVGRCGLLAAINASNGYVFWYLHSHDERLSAISAPCRLPGFDLDEDGVEDFAVLGTVVDDEESCHNREFAIFSSPTPDAQQPHSDEQVPAHVLLVSGSSGLIIGRLEHALPGAVHLPRTPTIGHNRLPLLVAYDFGNGSKSLLVLLSYGGDGTRINGTAILMASLDEHHAVDDTALCPMNDTVDRRMTNTSEFKTLCSPLNEIYRGSGMIDAIVVVNNGNESQGNVVVLKSDPGSLICLSGSNGFHPMWAYNVTTGFKMSEPTFGKFNDDAIMDMFVISSPIECLSASNCQSQVVVLDGHTGQELKKIRTEYPSFSPLVVHVDSPFNSDIFMFKIIGNESQSSTDTRLSSALECKNDNCSHNTEVPISQCLALELIALSGQEAYPLWEIEFSQEPPYCFGTKMLSDGKDAVYQQKETGGISYLISVTTDANVSDVITFNLQPRILRLQQKVLKTTLHRTSD